MGQIYLGYENRPLHSKLEVGHRLLFVVNILRLVFLEFDH